MISDAELKRRIGLILGLEEHPDKDWTQIARLSSELLPLLPEAVPTVVRAYLSDSDLRRVSSSFAMVQRSELVQFLRSS